MEVDWYQQALDEFGPMSVDEYAAIPDLSGLVSDQLEEDYGTLVDWMAELECDQDTLAWSGLLCSRVDALEPGGPAGEAWVGDLRRDCEAILATAAAAAGRTLIEVGEPCWTQMDLAIGLDHVWVADFCMGRVIVVDPVSEEVVALTPQTGAWDVVIESESAWYSSIDGDRVTIVSMAGQGTADSLPVGSGPTSMTARDGAVWVFNSGDQTISHIDAGGLTVVDTVAADGIDVYQMAVDDARLWLLDSESGRVHSIDLGTGELTEASGSVGRGASGLTTGGGAVWLADTLEGTIIEFDALTGSVDTTIEVGSMPGRVVYADDTLWIADFDDTAVFKVDPTDGEAERISLGGTPVDIATGDGSVWALLLTLDGTAAVTKVAGDASD